MSLIRLLKLSAPYLPMVVACVAAQTTVTTSGGTINTVPVFTGSTAVANSPLSYNPANGYVGISDSNPAAALDVNGSVIQRPASASSTANYLQTNGFNTGDTVKLNPGILFYSNGSYIWGADLGFSNAGRYATRFFGAASGDVVLSSVTSNPTSQSAFTDRLTVRGYNGFVGIGTSNPYFQLEVNGNIAITNGSTGGIVFADGTVQTTKATGSSGTGPAGPQGPTGPTGPQGPTGSTGLPNVTPLNGNIGVGTTNPSSLLTLANPANDTQGNFVSGLLFVDTVFGTSNPWAQAAIYTSGSPGFNGDLIFATDGDNQWNVNPTEKMRILSNGYVGVGTPTPHGSLEINGNVVLTAQSGASMTFQDGTVQSTAWNGTTFGGDYAESVDVSGDRFAYESGDILAIDPKMPGGFMKADKPYSRLVAGVFSTKPGLVGRRTTTVRVDKSLEVPMAMMGIVPVKVSTENGSVEPGDLLVSSSTPGYAMKGTDPEKLTGAVIGKALSSLRSGTKLIEALISLQ